jgi:hypothetical protein
MFREDYIMRQIRQFIQVLEQVIFKKKQGQKEEVQTLISKTLNELLEESERDFNELSLEESLSAVGEGESVNPELALVIAELLYEQEGGDREKSRMQALLLYKKAMGDASVPIPLNAMERVAQLEDQLSEASKDQINTLLGSG